MHRGSRATAGDAPHDGGGEPCESKGADEPDGGTGAGQPGGVGDDRHTSTENAPP